MKDAIVAIMIAVAVIGSLIGGLLLILDPEPPVPKLTCMDMQVSIVTVDLEGFRARMSGEALICANEWWISSTYGPTIDAVRESGGEIVVKPWYGPRIGETQ